VLCINYEKMGWATFWAIFSQTRLVTLTGSKNWFWCILNPYETRLQLRKPNESNLKKTFTAAAWSSGPSPQQKIVGSNRHKDDIHICTCVQFFTLYVHNEP
jgi:hypothetical protein